MEPETAEVAKPEPLFKPGDIVRLRSGGPSMVIERTRPESNPPNCYCRWSIGGEIKGLELVWHILVHEPAVNHERPVGVAGALCEAKAECEERLPVNGPAGVTRVTAKARK